MTSFYDDTVILVYAKAPLAGSVNTRLIPDIGTDAATQLQQDFIHHRLSMLQHANLCATHLMCAPDIQHDCFTQCEKQYPVVLKQQDGSELGERMSNGAASALLSYKYCIVIGTDAPALDEFIIKQVIDELHAGADVVHVPAEDGGYVLLGLSKNYEFLFNDVSWGTDKVMQQTRDRLKENNVSFRELGLCWDVDTLEDYQRYQKLLAKELVID